MGRVPCQYRILFREIYSYKRYSQLRSLSRGLSIRARSSLCRTCKQRMLWKGRNSDPRVFQSLLLVPISRCRLITLALHLLDNITLNQWSLLGRDFPSIGLARSISLSFSLVLFVLLALADRDAAMRDIMHYIVRERQSERRIGADCRDYEVCNRV